MPNTAKGFPYPVATDTPDVPRDIKALADASDANMVRHGLSTVTFDANGDSVVIDVPDGYTLISLSWVGAGNPGGTGKHALWLRTDVAAAAIKSTYVGVAAVAWAASK